MLNTGSVKYSFKNYMILPTYIVCVLFTLNANARTLQCYLDDVKDAVSFSTAMEAMKDLRCQNNELVANFSAGHRYLRTAARADLNERKGYEWEGDKHLTSILESCRKIGRDHTLAIMLYTENKMNLFREVNKLCHGIGDKTKSPPADLEQIAPYVQLTVNALEKLPECGYDVLFRGDGKPTGETKHYLEQQNVSSIYYAGVQYTVGKTANKFTSTSVNLKVAVAYMTKPVNTLRIYLGFGAHAKDISGISVYPGEKECLISPLQSTNSDNNKNIDLSNVTTGEYAKIDGIKFVTSPGDFYWSKRNCKTREDFATAVQQGKSLADAVKIFKHDIRMFHNVTYDEIRARLRSGSIEERLAELNTKCQSDTSSIISDTSSNSDISLRSADHLCSPDYRR